MYKMVCVIASPRSGSNLLCEQLTDALIKVSLKPVVNLYEFLSPHAYATDSGKIATVDRFGKLQRPNPMPIDIFRLRRLSLNTEHIPVLKILPRDITAHNIDLLDKVIFDDPDVYKICLNRADVANQLLSYLISNATGVWHSNQGSDKRQQKIIHVGQDYMNELSSEIVMHYLWHAEYQHRCNQIIWYDEIANTTYPDLLGHDEILPQPQEKLNYDHIGTARSCMINADEVIDHAQRTENEIAGLRAMLR